MARLFLASELFFRANGEVGYARARHLGGDKRFYYHQQSLDYVKDKLREIADIAHGQVMDKSIEPSRIGLVIKESSMVGPGWLMHIANS